MQCNNNTVKKIINLQKPTLRLLFELDSIAAYTEMFLLYCRRDNI